jgi:hypothetical protein
MPDTGEHHSIRAGRGNLQLKAPIASGSTCGEWLCIAEVEDQHIRALHRCAIVTEEFPLEGEPGGVGAEGEGCVKEEKDDEVKFHLFRNVEM